MRKFNHADYAANPDKYRMFKTATVAANVFSHNGEYDIPAGDFVGISFLADVRNQMYRRDEPIYAVTNRDGKPCGILYATALADFCL